MASVDSVVFGFGRLELVLSLGKLLVSYVTVKETRIRQTKGSWNISVSVWRLNCIAHIRILYAQIDEEVADSDDGLRELDSGMSGLLVVLNEKLPYWREKLEVSYQSEPTTVILPPVC